MNSFFLNLILFLHDMCAPSHCFSCKQFLSSNKLFCDLCMKQLQPVVSSSIQITPSYTLTVHAVAAYQEPLKSVVVAKSWSDIVASYQLGELLHEHTVVSQIVPDFFIPIPLHWTRYAYRGYNQSDIMAKVLKKKMHIPVVDLLKRNKRTPILASFAHKERDLFMHDAFELILCDKSLYTGKHLVLVDDLMTTGATLKSAARQLLKLKPSKISAVVVGRVV